MNSLPCYKNSSYVYEFHSLSLAASLYPRRVCVPHFSSPVLLLVFQGEMFHHFREFRPMVVVQYIDFAYILFDNSVAIVFTRCPIYCSGAARKQTFHLYTAFLALNNGPLQSAILLKCSIALSYMCSYIFVISVVPRS